jgi:glycosyltransferase involved in cell wall biosynthesis
MKRSKPSICIVAHNAYGSIAQTAGRHIGGAEGQTTMMARWLADNGYRVSLLTWAEGNDREEVLDGVRVIKLCAKDRGLPGIRFFHPRLTALHRALKKADADIYYHNAAEYVTGIVATWCRLHRRKFVYSVAANVSCQADLPGMGKAYERVLYRRGLYGAHRRVVQTDHQRALLREEFGVEATVLRMPCPSASESQLKEVPKPSKPTVLWAGRVVKLKRMDWVLELAQLLPGVRFEIAAAANVYDRTYARELFNMAKSLDNVAWLTNVPRERMGELYCRAKCLCCTSTSEGFPNTFLEAWSYGRPVISSFDPDGIIQRLNLGCVAHDVRGLASAIHELVNSFGKWQEVSKNAREYFVRNHEISVSMPRFEELFVSLFRDAPPGGAPDGYT